MESQITSTMNEDQDQSSHSPTLVITDVCSLNAVEQSTVHDGLLNSPTVGPEQQVLKPAEVRLSQDCASGSDTEDEFFDCIVCGEGFSEMNNLLKHSVTHNEEQKDPVVLKEGSKENIGPFNNTSTNPDCHAGENVDFEVVDLTDDVNTHVNERAVFRDLENNGQGRFRNLSENAANTVNYSTDAFSLKPGGKSLLGTRVADHLLRAENYPQCIMQSEGLPLRPVSGNNFQDVIDLTDEQEQQHEVKIRETADETLVSSQSGHDFMAVDGYMAAHSKHRPHKCGICGQSFTKKAKLQRHMVVHTEERPFKCCTCGRGFKKKANMLSHKAVHGKSPYECSVCGKGFRLKHSMTLHMAAHNADPLTMDVKENSVMTLEHLACSGYGEVSETQQNATQHIPDNYTQGITPHMAVCNGDKPYKCTECGKQFRFHHHMDAHMAWHTGETPYVCQLCGKGFMANVFLQNHMVVHSDARPFECVICRRCFKTKMGLASHIRSHTVKQPKRSDV